MSDWKLRRQIVQVGAFLLVMVAVLSLYISYLVIWEGKELAENPLNMRAAAAKADIRRGTIFDAHGRILAQTQNDGSRTYPLGQVMAHLTGYNGENIGSAGLEGHANRELLGLTADMSRLGPVAQLLQTDRGNDIKTTIEADAQQAAYDGLAGRKGAVVVLDADTGAVLAMVSSPAYDPNNVEANWKELSQSADGALLNRTVQGLYPPGSTFKIITALAYYRQYGTFDGFQYECTGSYEHAGFTIHCANGNVHGTESIADAMANSCNCAFASMAVEKIDKNILRKTAEDFGFNQTMETDLPFMEKGLKKFFLV